MVHGLERLQIQCDDKARQFLASIMRFQFIIALVVAEHILHSTAYLSTFFQDTECDLREAMKESKTAIEMLRTERQNESVWDELYQSTLNLVKSFDISKSIPRRCGR